MEEEYFSLVVAYKNARSSLLGKIRVQLAQHSVSNHGQRENETYEQDTKVMAFPLFIPIIQYAFRDNVQCLSSINLSKPLKGEQSHDLSI